MRDPAQIHALYHARRAEQSPLVQRMSDVASHYHDDVSLPLPELDDDEKYTVPNLIAQGIDQFATRLSSVLPDMVWHPLDPAKPSQVKRAADRRTAAFGWWQASGMKLALKQRSRWLIAYASSPVLVKPDYATGLPCYEPRNPMLTLPAPRQRRWEVAVDDCLFSYLWTVRQLKAKYGVGFTSTERRSYGQQANDDTPVTCIEYLDGEQWTLLLEGPPGHEMHLSAGSVSKPTVAGGFPTGYSSRQFAGISPVRHVGQTGSNGPLLVLDHVIHDLGVCPVSVPGRFGLERATGQMDSLLGMRKLQARLMALEVLSVERAIFPNEWAVLDPTGQSQVVRLADGRKGEVGEIRGGQMHVTNLQPGLQTNNTLNYLERAQRLNGLIPSDFGGESASNIRTAKRGDSVLSAAVDPLLREYHELLVESLQHENRIAVRWARLMNKPVSVNVTWKGAKGRLSYSPRDLFDTDDHQVSYSHAGADISQLIVNSAQMQGTELISQDTARRMNPLIDDPDHEKQQVSAEKIDRAIFAGFEQAVASQQIGLPDAVYVRKLVREGTDIGTAIEKAQQRAQERQASAGEPGTPTGPVPEGAPEAQPGLSAGSPAEDGAGQPVIGPPSESQTNMAGLLRALATTGRAANAGGR